ncbi:MAG: HAD family hydrolase [Aestuariivirga sp.]|uniref:HAD family hydrolase n=1 Tax=Aestuariivirga sp. TaxID=2650926 RepID=UPI0038CFC433
MARAHLTRPMPAFDLVIFDCDGVLVDSEMLSAGVLMALMAEHGLPITPEIFRADFLGRSFANAAAQVERRYGRPLPDGFQQTYRERLLRQMRAELKPMAGVTELLRTLSCRYCLATSSSPERLAVTLGVTGLAPFFTGLSFTASEVERGKPAPDLFLHAARRMGVAASRSVVIEDSEMGLRGAFAAGMTAWHFAGGAHVAAGYRLPEDVVPHRAVASMAGLGEALAELGLCRNGAGRLSSGQSEDGRLT